jgi:hypothetical protein
MTNLQYEIRICKKNHIKVTMPMSICIYGKLFYESDVTFICKKYNYFL